MENKFSDIKIVMGLGNPDSDYKDTYHNVGKLMIDYLPEMLGSENSGRDTAFRKKNHSGLFEYQKTGNMVLIKPLNYMNENGKTAKFALKSFGAKASSLLVIHDDSDLEIGEYKISFGRGPAGHNGVKSVIENVGTNGFWRLRIGVRKTKTTTIGLSTEVRRIKAGEFVLKKISEADKKIIASAFKKSAREIFGLD